MLPVLLIPVMVEASAPLECHIPTSDVPDFLFNHLDIATFRSSLGSKRTQSDRTSSGLSPPPTTVMVSSVEMREGNGVRRLTLLERGGFNKDGIEDPVVRFEDRVLDYGASTPKVRANRQVRQEGWPPISGRPGCCGFWRTRAQRIPPVRVCWAAGVSSGRD